MLSAEDEGFRRMDAKGGLRRRCTWKTLSVAGLIALLIAVLVGWLVTMKQQPPPTNPAAAVTSLPALGAAHSTFGLQLLRAVVTEDENSFLSPLSVALGVAMISRGAGEGARQQIYEALHLGATSDEAAISQLYSNLLQHVDQADPSVTLTLANSVWSTAIIDPGYIAALKSSYASEVRSLTTAEPINAWVRETTHGLIPSLLDTVDSSTALLLINAVYFKGAWAKPFDAAMTSMQPFQTPRGPKQVAMMVRSADNFMYKENSKYQMVELPYGKGTDYAAYVVLPQKGVSCKTVVKDLTPDAFTGLGKMEGILRLPRLRLGQTQSLKPVLQQLGIADIFVGHLDRLADPAEGLAVTDVLHKAVVELNEEGTEAAAVTAMIVGRSMVIAQRFEMTVDRPFIFVLRLASTGDLLFLGHVVDPQP